ncbi:MAG: 23S rRNA (adenine(2503)-C(2))-methyltransferase RlmN [Eggerthellaceae bacterium]|nr:23S rRNA (adenine(2503)-C(2))-methyltransferase RlmN [Eggerthellaceae bacterium]
MNNEIRSFSVKEIEELIAQLGFPKFRSKQLYEWVHRHHAIDYDQMSNLPKALREKLSDIYPLCAPRVVDRQISKDGTRKYILELGDGLLVETVGMPSLSKDGYDRLSVCFSTQVGCAMECAFCATGKEGFTRQLTAAEMVDQILAVELDFGQRVTSVVAMGQGEPFLNYENTLKALRVMNDPGSFNIGARHITISTCGIFEGIRRLANEPEQFTLAISLHSAIQEDRDAIMPRVSNQKLSMLKKELISYVSKTNRRVSLEYLLMRNINDTNDHLRALLDFCDGLLCHVNILPINDVEESPFKPSSKHTLDLWMSTLSNRGIETTLRNSRGSDIDGACGQLKNSFVNKVM